MMGYIFGSEGLPHHTLRPSIIRIKGVVASTILESPYSDSKGNGLIYIDIPMPCKERLELAVPKKMLAVYHAGAEIEVHIMLKSEA